MLCGTCKFEMWQLRAGDGVLLVCRRCDTSGQGGGRRVGPPNAPGTRDGWFDAPFGDKR